MSNNYIPGTGDPRMNKPRATKECFLESVNSDTGPAVAKAEESKLDSQFSKVLIAAHWSIDICSMKQRVSQSNHFENIILIVSVLHIIGSEKF